MISHSRFLSIFVKVVSRSSLSLLPDTSKSLEHSLVKLPKGGDVQWQNDGSTLKQCWSKPLLGKQHFFQADVTVAPPSAFSVISCL